MGSAGPSIKQLKNAEPHSPKQSWYHEALISVKDSSKSIYKRLFNTIEGKKAYPDSIGVFTHTKAGDVILTTLPFEFSDL
jgi:hypothetical protein